MTINVHEDHDRYAGDPAWTEVGRQSYVQTDEHPAFCRIDYAANDRTCLHVMRGWQAPMYGAEAGGQRVQHGRCLLEPGHRGRHATIVFYCDGCGRTRRGEPHVHDEDVSFCFMCARGI